MRPVPRSFTLPRSVQPEQARFRRWTATYSFLRLATTAVTLVLIILLSGDLLLGMGILPAPSQARPARESAVERQAAPADRSVQSAPAAQPTESAAEEAPLAQAAPAEAQPEPSADAAVVAQEQEEAPRVMAAPQAPQEQVAGAAQNETAATAAPPSPAMAPKRAAASPEEPTPQPGAADETPRGFGGGEKPAEPYEAPTEAPTMAPLPTEAPPTIAPPTMVPPTVAPIATPEALALESGEQPTLEQEAPAAGGAISERPTPVREVQSTLRLLWIGMVGLLFMLLAALLWVGAKRQV